MIRLAALLALIAAALIGPTTAQATTTCAATVTTSSNVQAVLDAHPGQVVCFTKGTYTTGFPYHPPSGTTLVGNSSTLTSTTAAVAIDGWGTSADNVKARRFTIKGFSTSGVRCRGKNWTMTYVTSRDNGADGFQDCAHLDHITATSNGRNGVIFGGTAGVDTGPYTLTNSTISNNNTSHADPNDEADGAKLMQTANYTVTGNQFTGNYGHGLWFDWANKNITIQSNTFSGNTWSDLFYEASYDATISGNTLANGIEINDGTNVTVSGNTITGGSILETNSDRGSTTYGLLQMLNTHVSANIVHVPAGVQSGMKEWMGDPSYYTSKGNTWTGNTWYLGCAGATPFIWLNPGGGASEYTDRTAAQWVAAGNDSSAGMLAGC